MSDAITKPAEPSAQDDVQAQADFDAGAEMEATGNKAPAVSEDRPRGEDGKFIAASPEKPPAKSAGGKGEDKPAGGKVDDKPGDKPGDKPAATDAKPEYVQITKTQLDDLLAASAQTKEFEKQFSKVFGTVGDMQKILRGLQAQTPKGAAVKLPPSVFDAMKKDFPEMAVHMQTVMTEVLKGIEGTGTAAADPEEFERKFEERMLKAAAAELAEEFPDWYKIVGGVDTAKGEKPDPNNVFRKWLATKPQDYQDRINTTNSAGVITRAIRTFRSETKTPAPAPKPNKQAEQRANRIQEAVRPRGDAGHPPASNTEDDFEAGFKAG